MRDNASSQPAAPTTIWTPANIVTLIRILLVPVFFVACVSPWPTWFPDWNEAELLKPWLAALLFVVLFLLLLFPHMSLVTVNVLILLCAAAMFITLLLYIPVFRSM